MRLTELLTEKILGTYIGIHATDKCTQDIKNWIKENGIKTEHNDYHVTIIIDKEKSFAETPQKHSPPLRIAAKDCKFDLFGPDNNVLVVTFNEPTLTNRHNEIKEKNDINFDFTEYIPHVTLSYDWNMDENNIPKWTVDLEFAEEYTTPFNDDWSPKSKINELGLIVPGVNTTDDVKPGETERQAAKFGNKLGKNGQPPSVWDSAKAAGRKKK